VTAKRLVHDADMVRTHLVAQSARAGMEKDDGLSSKQTQRAGRLGREHLVDDLHLDEVVPASQRSELVVAPLLGAPRHT